MSKKNVKIFIASSSEVKEERERCIVHLNQVNKSHKHLDLEPVEWEYDMAHGSYPDFATVQDAINPLLEECAFCIFIFYSKIGKYTRQEFDLADKLGMKLFAFFKENFSPKNAAQIKSYGELLDFKQSLNDTLLYKEYDDDTKFAELLKDNLHKYLSESFPVSSPTESTQLSAKLVDMVSILQELQNEISELKSKSNGAQDQELIDQLDILEKDRNSLLAKLNENKEVQKKQALEKKELEAQLAAHSARDDLKEKALKAINESDYVNAEKLLKESAEFSIKETVSTFFELGKLKKLQFDYKEALNYFDLAFKLKPDDINTNLEAGNLQRDLGFNDKALMHFKRATKAMEKDAENNLLQLAALNLDIAKAYHNKGNYKTLKTYFKKIKKFYNQYEKSGKELGGDELNNIGIAHDLVSEYGESIKYYDRSLAKYLEADEVDNTSVANIKVNLGAAYYSSKKYKESIKYYEEGLKVYEESYGLDHPEVADCYYSLGLAYKELDDKDKAIDYLIKALNTDKKFFGENHPNVAQDYSNLGMIYSDNKDYEKAEEYYAKALDINKRFYGDEHPEIATILHSTGVVLYNGYSYKEAAEYFNRAYKMYTNFYEEDHNDITNCHHWLGLCYYHMGEFAMAKEKFERVLAVRENETNPDQEVIDTLKNDIINSEAGMANG